MTCHFLFSIASSYISCQSSAGHASCSKSINNAGELSVTEQNSILKNDVIKQTSGFDAGNIDAAEVTVDLCSSTRSYKNTCIKEHTCGLELDGSDISSKTQFVDTETDIQDPKIQNVIGSPCTKVSNEPKYIIPQINDMETLSKATNCLFYKSRVWP